jgi:hypothetical protein
VIYKTSFTYLFIEKALVETLFKKLTMKENTGENKKICIVTGCSTLSTSIVRHLLQGDHSNKINEVHVFLFHGEESGRKQFEELGAKVDILDPNDREGLKEGFKNRESVFILPPLREESYKWIPPVMEACNENKVCCVGLASWIGTEHATHDSNLGRYYEIEKMFKELKNIKCRCVKKLDYFNQDFIFQAPSMQDHGLIFLNTGDNKFAPVDACDVSEALACLLATHDPNKEGFEMLHFVGPQKLNGKEIAEIAAKTLHGDYSYKDTDREECISRLMKHPKAEKFKVEMICDYFDLVRENKIDESSNDLKDVLKREPRKLEVFFKENESAFRPS